MYWLSLLFPEECITMYRYFILLSAPCFTIIFTNCFRNFSSVLFSVFTKIIIRSISIRIKKSYEKIKNYFYLFFYSFLLIRSYQWHKNSSLLYYIFLLNKKNRYSTIEYFLKYTVKRYCYDNFIPICNVTWIDCN